MSQILASSESVTAAYIGIRTRVIELLRSTPEDQGDLRVPSCPEWTVRQLVAHLVGVPEDILTGNMEGVTTEPWTAAQVSRHSGKSLCELADSYESTGQVFDDVLPMIPEPVNSQMVMDAATHEFDLREALGNGDDREVLAVDVALRWLRHAFITRMPPDSADPFEVEGSSPYELLRSLTGRRSPEQMDALGLDGAAIAAMLAGTPLAPPS